MYLYSNRSHLFNLHSNKKSLEFKFRSGGSANCINNKRSCLLTLALPLCFIFTLLKMFAYTSMEILGLILAICLGVWMHRRQDTRDRLPLPPGPKKLPIIGNLLDFPSSFEWETFQAWSVKYSRCLKRVYMRMWCWYCEVDSPIIHLSVAGRSLIVLNTLESARDLIEKRSAIYSGR